MVRGEMDGLAMARAAVRARSSAATGTASRGTKNDGILSAGKWQGWV